MNDAMADGFEILYCPILRPDNGEFMMWPAWVDHAHRTIKINFHVRYSTTCWNPDDVAGMLPAAVIALLDAMPEPGVLELSFDDWQLLGLKLFHTRNSDE